MVKSVGGLVVGIICLILAIISALVFKRYIAALGSGLIAIACIYKAIT